MNTGELNLMVGLEIHRQIDSNKLFCKCPSVFSDGNPDRIIKRRLRAVESEIGEKDKAAIFETLKDKEGVYEYFNESACLIELDEEPILGINEEDLTRKVRDSEKESVYRLDRLGIPLIEITTKPDMGSPEEVKEVASYIGMVLKSTGKFKSGLGTIRQDLNISIKKGNRVEIKGVQDLRNIPKIIDNEIERQLRGKVNEEVRMVREDLKTEFLRPMPGASRMYPETDISWIKTSDFIKDIRIPELIKEKISELVKKGVPENIANDAVKLGINLKDYKDIKLAANILVEKPKEIKKRFGIEISTKNLERALRLLDESKITIDSATDALVDMENEKFDISKYKKVDAKDVKKEIQGLMKKGMTTNAVMGILMEKYRGRISGKELSEMINEK